MNVAGVLSIVSLARKMTQLQALVDVSTAYANCDQSHIEEKIYPAPGNPKKMVEMCQWMDPAILDSPEVTKKVIGNRPNTYTYTKVHCTALHCTALQLHLLQGARRVPAGQRE
jgi:fatty acyl-CoA reductase